jgi:hypothetical protein
LTLTGLTPEQAELHRILEREQWVFGERYHLMVSDKGLNAVIMRVAGCRCLAARSVGGGCGRLDCGVQNCVGCADRWLA